MTRVNYLKCDVCGHVEYPDEPLLNYPHRDGRGVAWCSLGGGRHACSPACYVKDKPLAPSPPLVRPKRPRKERQS